MGALGPETLCWVAGEISHTTEGDAEKYCGCAEEIPKIIVTTAEGLQEEYDPDSRPEAPYAASQRHVTAVVRQ